MAWLHVPGTDSPSAQAAEDSIWASCSPSPVSTPAASSSGKNTPAAFSSPRSAQDTSPQPRSGTTLPHSTDGPSAAPSIPSSRDTRASLSVRQDSAREPTTSGISGQTLPGSSARSSRNGSSSKTSRGTSASALKPCCETYGTWAGRLRLAYSRRLKLARRMKGSAGSAWPTANAGPQNDADGNWQKRRETAKAKHNNGNGFGLTLGMAATMRGTPPRASDAEKGGPNMAFGAGGTPLPAQAARWPTPSAMQDTKGDADVGAIQRRETIGKQIGLAYRARLFSRPAPEKQMLGLPSSDPRQTWRRLRRLVISTHGRAVWKRMAANGGKRRLNPNFVAWLMGWPIDHPSCACSATEWSRYVQHMRSALSRLPTASGPWIWEPNTEIRELEYAGNFLE